MDSVSLSIMGPELIVVAGGVAVLALDLLRPGSRRLLSAAVSLVLLAALAAVAFGAPGELFGGRFVTDAPARWFKAVFVLAALAASIMAAAGWAATDRGERDARGEFLTILLFTVAGMMFLVSARDLVTLYLGLELATIPLFALAAWNRHDLRSSEAGFKYVVLGALASAFLLYGLGLIFAMSGSTAFHEIRAAVQPSPLLWVALGFIITGIGFKLTLVPFHFWAADVYEGAPVPVTAYLSVASKAAGLGLFFQLYYRVLPALDWSLPVALLAAATMTFGNVAALVQGNIKRLMAFSAVSQAGYLLIGFLVPGAEGAAAAIYYMVVYLATNLAAFAVVFAVVEQAGEKLAGFRGLAQTNPFLAGAMMLALFSLAGIPPLAGFVGKIFLFNVAAGQGLYWLVGVAAVNSTISLYYYLRIVREMYIEAPLAGAAPVRARPSINALAGVTALATVALGLAAPVYETIRAQMAAWLA